jgi:hypothetical protein
LGFHNEPCSWGYHGWGGGHCWNIVEMRYFNDRHVRERIHRDPGVIRRFNPGPGSPSWPGVPGRRPVPNPWRRGPLLVNQQEFRNPVAIRPLLEDRTLNRRRLLDYERQAQSTGRTVYRREIQVPSRPSAPAAQAGVSNPPAGRPSFEDRNRVRPIERRPIVVATPRRDDSSAPRRPDQPQSQPRPQIQTPGRRSDFTPARPSESRGSAQDRPQSNPAPQREPNRERPRIEDRPRETPANEPRREAPREERRAPERPREDRSIDRRPERPASPPAVSRPAERPAERPSAPSRPESRSDSPRSREPEKRR